MPEVVAGYERQYESTLAVTLAANPSLRARLGGEPAQWSVTEVGDGNLNLVFIVKGLHGGVVAKQALPFVRMVGESWPLPLSRSHFEHMALVEHARLCPALTPAVLHRDGNLALTVMELLEPHITLRRGLIDGHIYPRFADAMSTFLARTLFFTSDLALPAAEKKARMAAFAGNTAMCRITEDLVFTEPYHAAPNNRWTSPQLDEIVSKLKTDMALKLAAARLKVAFLCRTEALLHGDLHSGAIMVTDSDTRIIDAEFAFYGPMAFDIGLLIANLLISACAQQGYEAVSGERRDHVGWILEAVNLVWDGFRSKFIELWRTSPAGDAFSAAVFDDPHAKRQLDEERHRYVNDVFYDAVGFAGLEIIRRVVGLSHVIDFEYIVDRERRARCELRAILIGREFVVNRAQFDSIQALTRKVQSTIEASALTESSHRVLRRER